MFVLRQRAKSGFLYFVDYGVLGFPLMSPNVTSAHQFTNRGDAEKALSRVAQSFDVIEV